MLVAVADQRLSKVPLGFSPVIFYEEVIYNRITQMRRARHCFDKDRDAFPYLDVEDGSAVEKSSWRIFSRRFLQPSSQLPTPMKLPSMVYIRADTEVLTIAPNRDLKAGSFTALTEPSFVALLFGVRSGNEFFWELHDSFRFVGTHSDQPLTIKNIPEGLKRFVFLLLKEYDPMPRVNIPKDKVLHVYHRPNFRLYVESGHLWCDIYAPIIDIDEWNTPVVADNFLLDFSAAARS